jgi:osmotically-inducible protein OsmY
MPNRRNYRDEQQRSNEPYGARSEYARRSRQDDYGVYENARGEQYYDSDSSRFGSGQRGAFTGADFGRGYDPAAYPETYGGHGIYEGTYHRPYSSGDRTDYESGFQNRGRRYETGSYGPGGDGRYEPGNDRGYGRGHSSQRYVNPSDFPGSERGFYAGRPDDRQDRYYSDAERGWWDKAADEVSSWMGDEEAARRRESDHLRHHSYRGHGPRNYKRSDDRIREDINDRLTDHAYLDASEIDVAVSDGDVTLTGSVINRYAKRMAEDIADDVSGVKNVENRLRAGNKESWVSGTGDINAAGNRSTFQDVSENPKTMAKKA